MDWFGHSIDKGRGRGIGGK